MRMMKQSQRSRSIMERWRQGVPPRLTRAVDTAMPFIPILRLLAFFVGIIIVTVMVIRAARDTNLATLSTWPLALAIPCLLVWWLLLARGWSLLVSGASRRSDISLWFRTQAIRYLPGGIWAPVSRATLLPGSLSDKLATVGAENLIALCTASAVGGLAMAVSGRPIWLPLLLAPASPLILSRLLAIRTRLTVARALAVTGNDVVAFVGYALAAAFVQQAVSGRMSLFVVAGAAAIAWAAGLVVVIAPSGLGVRELVYVAILSGVYPSSQTTTAAVTLRGGTVLVELVVLILLGRPSPTTSGEGMQAAPETGAGH
jgi:glycosyltransferase 2 family protein